MKRVGHLFEALSSFGALRWAALRAARGKRRSRDTQDFLLRLESNVLILEESLQKETYEPLGYRTFFMYEKKPRLICAAPFRDRVVHHALCSAMEGRLEQYAIDQSFACRVGKGTFHALRYAQKLASQGGYFLKLDIARFFASVDHGVLKGLLERLWKDRRLLSLCGKIVDCVPNGFAVGKGLPIGNLTSQQFANLYLGAMDHFIKEQLRTRRYLRYMDDFVLFGEDKASLWERKQALEDFLRERLLLSLREERSILAPVSEGLPWLGFRVWPSLVRLQGKTKFGILRRIRNFRGGEEGGSLCQKDLASCRSLNSYIQQANTREMLRGFWGKQG